MSHGFHPRNVVSNSAKKVHGEYHATSGTVGEITLYDETGAAVTLGATERLVVTWARVQAAVGGDTAIIFDKDDDNALDAGEVILRGTTANNQSIDAQFDDPRVGPAGAKPHCIYAAGAVDAQLAGYIVKG